MDSTSTYGAAGPPSVLTSATEDEILVQNFDSMEVASEEVRNVMVAMREALVANTHRKTFWIALQPRGRPDAFISAATQVK